MKILVVVYQCFLSLTLENPANAQWFHPSQQLSFVMLIPNQSSFTLNQVIIFTTSLIIVLIHGVIQGMRLVPVKDLRNCHRSATDRYADEKTAQMIGLVTVF